DPRDHRRAQAQPGRADRDVGGATAYRFGETANVLEPGADLLAIEVDRRAADGYDVEPIPDAIRYRAIQRRLPYALRRETCILARRQDRTFIRSGIGVVRQPRR